MHAIPPLGWVAIAAVILVTLAVNVWMITLLRNRQNIHPAQRPGPGNLPKLQDVLRDPFGQENRQMEELSKRVQEIRQVSPDEPGQAEKGRPGSS